MKLFSIYFSDIFRGAGTIVCAIVRVQDNKDKYDALRAFAREQLELEEDEIQTKDQLDNFFFDGENHTEVKEVEFRDQGEWVINILHKIEVE